MVVGLEAGCGEGALEAALEQLGDLAAEMPDEHELAVACFLGDTRKHRVVLRQILEQRLRAPIGDGVGAKAQPARVTVAGGKLNGS